MARTAVLAEFAGTLDKLSEADQSAGMFPLARRGHVVAQQGTAFVRLTRPPVGGSR